MKMEKKMNKEFKKFEFKPVTIDKLRFKAVDYHRNGVSGEGFYCAVARDNTVKKDMLITCFPDVGYCAVYALDLLPDIRFAHNSWRGDNYEGSMRKAIKELTRQTDEFYSMENGD